jgi:hypothetical protein
MTDDALARALEQQDAATAAMLNGDPSPRISGQHPHHGPPAIADST